MNRWITLAFVALFFNSLSFAQTTAFTYQGELDFNSLPANGNYTLVFTLFDDATLGGVHQIGSPITLNNQSVTSGLFTVSLDFGASAFPGARRWVEIKVNGNTLSPREEITPAAYAMMAQNGAALNGQSAAFYQNASNINAGSLGDARLSANVTLLNNIQTFTGAKTFSTAPSFTAVGAPFTVTSATKVTNLNADLLDGLDSTAFLTGVPNPLTLSGSQAGGYILQATNTSNAGGSTGVFGSGFTFGGYFLSSSTSSASGIGVFGYASSSTGPTMGGLFRSDSTDGRALYGQSTAGSGPTYGVYGESLSASGYGVWAQGRTGASGTKSFRIDHPDDPENKYLLHYSHEGPEPENVYNGNVTTDAHGEAWIDLPSYFGEINKDPRYTLTVVDDSDSKTFVQAKIAKEIRGNRFKIRTSAPRVKVSWEVKAVRNDRWVQRYGAPVEVEKEGLERGKYQHPELYDAPPEMGVNSPQPPHAPQRPTIATESPKTIETKR